MAKTEQEMRVTSIYICSLMATLCDKDLKRDSAYNHVYIYIYIYIYTCICIYVVYLYLMHASMC
jgi:hypothetical protein